MFSSYERGFFSQNGEDGVIEEILDRIGTATQPFMVEIACGDGAQCNGRYLVVSREFRGLFIDGRHQSACPDIQVVNEFVTRENVNELLDKYQVPQEIDVLSIDIDGNDYHIWKAIGRKARLVVMEYNANIPPTQEFVVDYDPKFSWQGDEYFGASLLSLAKLGEELGYTLVYCEKHGVNAFFVRKDLLTKLFPVTRMYRPPNYFGLGLRHKKSDKLDHLDRRTTTADPAPKEK